MNETGGSRKADAIVGALFLAVGVAILPAAWPSTPLGAVTAAALVGGLGLEAIIAALRGRRSLLSRIGPLP